MLMEAVKYGISIQVVLNNHFHQLPNFECIDMTEEEKENKLFVIVWLGLVIKTIFLLAFLK